MALRSGLDTAKNKLNMGALAGALELFGILHVWKQLLQPLLHEFLDLADFDCTLCRPAWQIGKQLRLMFCGRIEMLLPLASTQDASYRVSLGFRERLFRMRGISV